GGMVDERWCVTWNTVGTYWRRVDSVGTLSWPMVSVLKWGEDPMALLYGVYAFPAHIFIDGNGEVVGSGLRAGAVYDFVRDYLATHEVLCRRRFALDLW